MKHRRIPVGLATLGTALLLGATLAAPAAGAAAPEQVTGGCSVTVNGTDANTAHNASNAIEVGENDTVNVVGNAPGPITGYTVKMKLGPIKFTAKDEATDGTDTTWTGRVKVSDYAQYGVGLYRVEGASTGTVCTGWAYLKVTGKFPLTTVAGATAAAFTVVGAAGMASAARRPKLKVGRP
jgi:hypothetical protein